MDTNQSLERTSQGKTERVCSAILKISVAFNVALSKETQAIYLSELIHLSDPELASATTATIREWPESSKMPPLNFILTRARAVVTDVPRGRKYASVADIDPERCPKGWTPEDVFRAHLTIEKIHSEARR